jgi:hypothetical protein
MVDAVEAPNTFQKKLDLSRFSPHFSLNRFDTPTLNTEPLPVFSRSVCSLCTVHTTTDEPQSREDNKWWI